MDTGTPRIPVPPKVFDSAAQLIDAELDFLWDGGSGGAKVGLSKVGFPLHRLRHYQSSPQEPGAEASRSAIFSEISG